MTPYQQFKQMMRRASIAQCSESLLVESVYQCNSLGEETVPVSTCVCYVSVTLTRGEEIEEYVLIKLFKYILEYVCLVQNKHIYLTNIEKRTTVNAYFNRDQLGNIGNIVIM